MKRFALFAMSALLLLSAPLAQAEFGPESEDGYPINVEGEVLRPPVLPLPLVQLDPELDRALGVTEGDPLNKVGPFTAYPYYPLLTAEVQRLAQDHPDLVRLSSAGTSTAGLDIWMLEIADFDRIEAGEGVPLEQREVVYLDGGTHSNEYSGVYFVTEWAQFLLDEYETNETAQWIVENRHTFLIPMVNPDGSHLFGRLNANLVNVNRNFPVLWGALAESPVLNNPGPAPASEPETRVVIDALNATRPDYVASIHCCGNLWLYPYGVEGLDPLDNTTFARVCDEVFPTVRDDCGPIWSTIYPASGSTVDTAYEYVGAFAWGFEMSGRGAIALWGQPATDADVREQERESWHAVLHAFLNVEKYGAHPRLVSLEGTHGRLVAVVENSGWGTLHAGNLTLGTARAALPTLAPGERASVVLGGAFAVGPTEAHFDWQKRIMAAPQGAKTLDVVLSEQDGRLLGTFTDGEAPLDPLAAAGAVPVPGPGAALLVVGGALAAVALGRGRRGA